MDRGVLCAIKQVNKPVNMFVVCYITISMTMCFNWYEHLYKIYLTIPLKNCVIQPTETYGRVIISFFYHPFRYESFHGQVTKLNNWKTNFPRHPAFEPGVRFVAAKQDTRAAQAYMRNPLKFLLASFYLGH